MINESGTPKKGGNTRDLNAKASEVYKARDRFYEFHERHETLSKVRRKIERRGAVYMAIFLCLLIAATVWTHKNAEYSLITKLFG